MFVRVPASAASGPVELLPVVESAFRPAGLGREPAVALVEALRIDIVLVDVDLDRVDVAGPRR
jgi:hypothetical protein